MPCLYKCFLLAFLLYSVGPDARADKPKPFADVYAEGLRLSRVNTYAGFGQARAGIGLDHMRWELYGIVRGGMDSRTLGDPGDDIFNDNYVFTGIGVDANFLLPGVRFTNQVGASFDLTDKLDRDGFDFRTGVITYHEWPLPKVKLVNEFYSESLYVHRYRNFIANGQWRGYFRLLNVGSEKHFFHAGPLFWLSATGDSAGNDYNRFFEARAGARIGFWAPGKASVWLAPFYAWGARYERPTNLPNYRDFRILLVTYFQL